MSTTTPARSSVSPDGRLDAHTRFNLNLNPAHWGVQTLAEIGIAVALAAVLGQLRFFVMPQGGSVSLELLPIIFVAVRSGVVPGLTAGLLYGLVQLFLPGAFVYHPVQAALDYPLAFMAWRWPVSCVVKRVAQACFGGRLGGRRTSRVPLPLGARSSSRSMRRHGRRRGCTPSHTTCFTWCPREC